MIKKYQIKCELLELDPEGYHIVFKAKIQKQPIYLLIDTGANHTCFDRRFVESIQQESPISGKDNVNVGIGGNDFDTVISEVHDLKIGRLGIPTLTVRLLDLQQISTLYEELGFHAIQGIIGGDFLQKYHAVIDYAAPSITLSI